MIITVKRGGRQAARWGLAITSAHYVWEKAGAGLRTFEGRQSGECAALVRDAITRILNDPRQFIATVGYYDLRGTTAALVGLFFTLRECPEGTVHVN